MERKGGDLTSVLLILTPSNKAIRWTGAGGTGGRRGENNGTVGGPIVYSEALNNEMADITTMKSVGTAGTRYSGDYSLYRAAPDIAMIWPLFHT